MINTKLILRVLILVCVAGIVASCAQPATKPATKEVPVVKYRQDMDNVVQLKGIPRQVQEVFVGGTRPVYHITIFFVDEMCTFQTDEAKSYTVLLNKITLTAAIPQQPIPLWFKTKYQNLDWTSIPTK
jgi:hypothetical protein